MKQKKELQINDEKVRKIIEEAYIKMGNAFRDPETGELYVLKKSEEKKA